MPTDLEVAGEQLKNLLRPPLTPAQGWLRTVLFRWDILDDYDRRSMIELSLKALKRLADAVERIDTVLEQAEATEIKIDGPGA